MSLYIVLQKERKEMFPDPLVLLLQVLLNCSIALELISISSVLLSGVDY